MGFSDGNHVARLQEFSPGIKWFRATSVREPADSVAARRTRRTVLVAARKAFDADDGGCTPMHADDRDHRPFATHSISVAICRASAACRAVGRLGTVKAQPMTRSDSSFSRMASACICANPPSFAFKYFLLRRWRQMMAEALIRLLRPNWSYPNHAVSAVSRCLPHAFARLARDLAGGPVGSGAHPANRRGDGFGDTASLSTTEALQRNEVAVVRLSLRWVALLPAMTAAGGAMTVGALPVDRREGRRIHEVISLTDQIAGLAALLQVSCQSGSALMAARLAARSAASL